MRSNQILSILRESGALLKQDVTTSELTVLNAQNRYYNDDEVPAFMTDLTEAGNKVNLIFLDNTLAKDRFQDFLDDVYIPIVAFEKAQGGLTPIIIYKKKSKIRVLKFDADSPEIINEEISLENLPSLHTNKDGKVVFMGVFGYKSLVSNDPEDKDRNLSPVQRLIRLLSEEKRDIGYIYLYATIIGFISLTLPLGIQATVSLISGGVFFSSVYILIAFVILGVLAAGGLQVLQVTLVEYLQRRIFTKAAFEFAFRVPRIKVEALQEYHAPELMNRFFDVLTLQKGLPKLLIDLSSAVIQILFGLILLSFYHPFFVFFGLLLVGILAVIFYQTGPKGLSSSIKESKFKYRVVYWLEEVARTINSFKLSGNTNLPLRKTDFNVNNYLKNRKVHFGVLINQYIYVILFKAFVTGGLLIMGTVLVVQREITLGQFVASEVIIILTITSVEKIITYMDVVYDMLTAVDKISNVTDLPLEKSGGIEIKDGKEGFAIRTKNLYYKFPNENKYTLKDINVHIKSGQKVCISGHGGSGKSVLLNTLSGLNVNYEGVITLDAYSLKDLDLNKLRDKIGKNVSQQDIFEGTIMENILVGKPYAEPKDAVEAINMLRIDDEINAMPQGINTPIVSSGKGLSNSLINKIILARCLAKKPRMLILNDFFENFIKTERCELIEILTQKEHQWTVVIVSNDSTVMKACDEVLLMKDGTVYKTGSYDELLSQGELTDLSI
ncbi:ATP-binding cassette domain-containing protein [Fulvivirga sp. RKSG066]|uniref:peptidase domain-containing ABC transporter n=1 Tax=Fulvivirga aurantia TaxID=2529383 RepID=UPI0012BD1A9E|nr:ATP-binding cassette domain-containing protein [Fulvivirga aurantia]MTI22795.1 ATP-binding cassette domain-containing protein [Fulvivirga aurantia]